MGQQQLLLIVLGVIVVGIAIVVGYNLFTANAISANKDGVTADLNNLAAMAQQFYKKPVAMGGGGNTYTGWTVPTTLATTPNGTYVATVAADNVSIVGTGTEKEGGVAISMTATITPTGVTVAPTAP